MTVALRMTGALLVVPGNAPGSIRAGRVRAHRRPRGCGTATSGSSGGSGCGPAADFGASAPGAGALEADRGGAPVPDRRGLQRPRSEPLSRGFTVERLKERRAKGAKLKTLLLDQSFIAGVGNIYADEALWAGAAAPAACGGHADDAEVRRLHRSIRRSCGRGSRTAAAASATT